MTPRAAILIGGRASEIRRWAPSWVRAKGSPRVHVVLLGAAGWLGPAAMLGAGREAARRRHPGVRGVPPRSPSVVAQGRGHCLKYRTECV